MRYIKSYFTLFVSLQKKIKTYESYLGEKNLMGSNILASRLHYIGAPSRQKHVFCFIFEHESR